MRYKWAPSWQAVTSVAESVNARGRVQKACYLCLYTFGIVSTLLRDCGLPNRQVFSSDQKAVRVGLVSSGFMVELVNHHCVGLELGKGF